MASESDFDLIKGRPYRSKVFLSIGSNLSCRETNISNAIKQLDLNIIKINRVSPIYETTPVGNPTFLGIECPFSTKQSNFLNCVVEATTDYEPKILLSKILEIEKSLGRKRIPGINNLPRTIDIDILFYDSKIIHRSRLKIPHPKLQTRAFILTPFCDVEPNFIHPVLNKSIFQLSENVDKTGVVLWKR